MRVRRPRLHSNAQQHATVLRVRGSAVLLRASGFQPWPVFVFRDTPKGPAWPHTKTLVGLNRCCCGYRSPAPVCNVIATSLLPTIPFPYGNFEKYDPGTFRQMLNASPNPSTTQSHLPAGNLDETTGSFRCIKVLAANQNPTGIDNINSGLNWKARARCPCNSACIARSEPQPGQSSPVVR
jgi:hypothetical protein